MTINLQSLLLGVAIMLLAMVMTGTGWYFAKEHNPSPSMSNELKIVIEEQLLKDRAELIAALVAKIDLTDCDSLIIHSVSRILPEVDISCIRKKPRKRK